MQAAWSFASVEVLWDCSDQNAKTFTGLGKLPPSDILDVLDPRTLPHWNPVLIDCSLAARSKEVARHRMLFLLTKYTF